MSQPLPKIPPRAPQPIDLLDANDAEMATVGAVVAAVSEKLSGLAAVVKQHDTVDYVDVLLDNDVKIRVKVQVLR